MKQTVEEYKILKYKTMWSAESQPAFQRNIQLTSSGSKNMLSKKSGLKKTASRAQP
jgi:hypothetical protein